VAEYARVVKARLPNGAVVPVEARASGDPETDVALRDVMSFEGVANSITSIADAMTSALEHIKPDKASVEFGVDVTVESGALTGLIVKGTGGATLTITLEWASATAENEPS
jgi:hypothetical protein